MIIAELLLYMNIFAVKGRGGKRASRLEAYLQATVVWAMLLFAFTEVLSAFYGIALVPLLLLWLVTDLILAVLLALQCKKGAVSIKELTKAVSPLTSFRWEKKYWVFVMITLGVVFLAFYTVPYNWDSMTYHLPRITHWAQNGSVAHYATNSIRQIASPVFGEFVNLHVYILSGGRDTLFLLLQCFSYLTGAVIVYEISRKLKCSPLFCYLAALLYLTMPIAFAEAVTTQVDHLATLWLLIFTYLLLDFTDMERKLEWDRNTIGRVCAMGGCVSLGYLTKPSVCVGMAVLVLWLLVICIARKDRLVLILRLVCCVLPCIVLPMIPELWRNLVTFQAISSPMAGQRQLVGTLHPLYLLVNMVKNLSFNLPNVFLYDINTLLGSLVTGLSLAFGVPLNDPSISEDGRGFLLHGAPNFEHDTAINPVVVWLFLICVVWGLLRCRKKELKRWYTSYSLAVSVAFLVFCTVLRWEPFVSRYMLSFLALLCPMIGYQLQRLTASQSSLALRHGIVGILCFLCISDMVSMGIYHRNMCVRAGARERPYGYFTNRSNEYEPYREICQVITDAGYTQLGLYMGEDSYEYPLWVMLKDSLSDGGRLAHVLVNNESAVYADETYLPECIIWLQPLPKEGVTYLGRTYDKVTQIDEGHYVLSCGQES